MNVKEIRDFCTDIKEYHDKRRKEQSTDQNFYDDKFDTSIQEPYHVIRTGTAARIVDSIVEHLELVTPQVFREPRKNTEEAKKSSLKMGRFLNYLVKQWQPEIGELYRNGVLRGEFVGSVQYDDEPRGKTDSSVPLTFTAPDPLNIYCDPYDAILPSRVVKCFSMKKMLAKSMSPNAIVYGGMCEYLAFWNEDERYFEIGKSPLTNDVEPNYLGFVPFVHGYSGFGKKSPDGDPSTLAVGRLRKIRGRLKEECEIESRVDSIIGLFANPIREIHQTDPNDRGADLKNLEEQMIAPGYNLVTPYGFESRLYTPEVASAQLFQHLYQIRQALGAEIPPIMQGQAAADATGRLADIQYEHASTKYIRLIHNLEICLAELLGMALRILELTPKALPLTVKATTIVKGETITTEETINKEDINGYYDCRVELNPEKDIQSDREVMLGRTLYKEQMIGWKKMLMDYMHMTEDEADDTIADALAEQAVASSPILAQMRIQEAMEQIGATKYLRQIQTETQEQGKMNKDLQNTEVAPYRPSETNNPTAVDVIRQAMGETPMGVRNPAQVV
jgi:hypothetical protein